MSTRKVIKTWDPTDADDGDPCNPNSNAAVCLVITDSDGDGISDEIENILSTSGELVITPSGDISNIDATLDENGNIILEASDATGSLGIITLPPGSRTSGNVGVTYDDSFFGRGDGKRGADL